MWGPLHRSFLKFAGAYLLVSDARCYKVATVVLRWVQGPPWPIFLLLGSPLWFVLLSASGIGGDPFLAYCWMRSGSGWLWSRCFCSWPFFQY